MIHIIWFDLLMVCILYCLYACSESYVLEHIYGMYLGWWVGCWLEFGCAGTWARALRAQIQSNNRPANPSTCHTCVQVHMTQNMHICSGTYDSEHAYIQTTSQSNDIIWIVDIRSYTFVLSTTQLPYLPVGPESAFFLQPGCDAPDWASSTDVHFFCRHR